MRNRFLGGVNFLPMFAPADKPGGGDDQPQLQLDPAEIDATGDPDWEANDPGDVGTVANDGDGDPDPDDGKAKDPEPEPVKADAEGEDGGGDEPEPETPEQELEQLRKTAKALGKRVSTLSKEKRELSAKLQSNIRPVADEPVADADGDEPVRSDFKTKTEFDAAVQAEADRRLAITDFNTKCNAVETAGNKAFGAKWGKAKADLAMLDDAGRIPLDILSVALETDNPAQVLFVLGNDIEKATELMGMTPIKRAIAMDRIAASKPHTETPRSRAPAPVEPIGGKGAGDDRPTDRDSDEEWNRKEEARERKLAEQRRKNGY